MNDDDKKKEKLDDSIRLICSGIGINLEIIYGKKMGFVLIAGEFNKEVQQISGNSTEKDCMKWTLDSAFELSSKSKDPTMHLDFMTATVMMLIKEGHVDTLQHWLNIAGAAVKSFTNDDKKDKLN